MTKSEEFLKGLAHMMECGGEKMVPEAKLEEIGVWDSLNVMGAVVLIDEVYGRVVHGRELSQCVTVGDVLKIAEGA